MYVCIRVRLCVHMYCWMMLLCPREPSNMSAVSCMLGFQSETGRSGMARNCRVDTVSRLVNPRRNRWNRLQSIYHPLIETDSAQIGGLED